MFNISIFGGSDLGKRPWKPGKKLWAISLLGGTSIDFQQAQLDEDVTKVVCISLLGGTEITLPKDMPVTLSGFSFLGGREIKSSQPEVTSDKSLHVTAFAILGGISIKPPKESGN